MLVLLKGGPLRAAAYNNLVRVGRMLIRLQARWHSGCSGFARTQRPFSGRTKPEQTHAANVPLRDATEPSPHHDETSGRVQLLDAHIQDEEKRTGISNVSNTAYPILARNLRTRRDNLLATITMLDSQTGA